MSLNKDFPYLPLTAPTQTRVILLTPGKSNDPIRCFQLVIDLDHDWKVSDGPCHLLPGSGGEPTLTQRSRLQQERFDSDLEIPGLLMKSASGTILHLFQGYTALSYVWGDQKNPHEIFIDGKPFHVGENLYTALLRLRQRISILRTGATTPEDFDDETLNVIKQHLLSESRFLWVDAICINQNDVAEREAQVKLMARIYQKADHVHGDLGRKEVTGGIELLHLMQKIIRAGDRCQSQLSPSKETCQEEGQTNSDARTNIISALESEFGNFQAGKTGNIREVRLPSPSTKVLEDHGIPREDDEVWKHWRQFLNSIYFQRLWIVQEASLATSITLWYSNVGIELEMVGQCVQYLRKYSTNAALYSVTKDEFSSSISTPPAIWAVIGLINQRNQIRGADGHLTKQVPLVHMLDLARHKQATNLRDKIFGLLGMASDGSDFLHLVTYSQSVEDVYQDFAKFFIERGQGISMLYQVDSRVSKTLKIPSWVPDWSRDRDDSSLQDELPALSSGLDGQKALEIRLSGSELVITGHILDTIKCLSTPMSSNLTWGTFSEIATLLWEGGNLLMKQNVEGDQAVEIMLHTLSCGSLSAKPAAEVESLRQGFTAVFGHGTFLINGGNPDESPWLPHMRHFLVHGMALAPGRRWCITEQGKFGLVPGGTKTGDRVAIFGSYSLPFILRDHLTEDSVSGQYKDTT
ncbi:Heterokaryon incompatibility 6, OR allele, partial [Fusarium agapanthi]